MLPPPGQPKEASMRISGGSEADCKPIPFETFDAARKASLRRERKGNQWASELATLTEGLRLKSEALIGQTDRIG